MEVCLMSRPRVLAWFWSFLLLVLHSIPRAGLLELPGGKQFVKTSGADKLAHVFLFGTFALLWLRSDKQRLLTILAVGLVYGAALELYQEWLIPGRSGSTDDLLADAVGLLIGAAVQACWARRRAAGS